MLRTSSHFQTPKSTHSPVLTTKTDPNYKVALIAASGFGLITVTYLFMRSMKATQKPGKITQHQNTESKPHLSPRQKRIGGETPRTSFQEADNDGSQPATARSQWDFTEGDSTSKESPRKTQEVPHLNLGTQNQLNRNPSSSPTPRAGVFHPDNNCPETPRRYRAEQRSNTTPSATQKPTSFCNIS